MQSAADGVDDELVVAVQLLGLVRVGGRPCRVGLGGFGEELRLRREQVALTEGSYRPLIASGDLLLFFRELRGQRLLIALNMGPLPLAASFSDERLSGHVLLSSFADREGEEVRASIDLRGNEGLLVKVDLEDAR